MRRLLAPVITLVVFIALGALIALVITRFTGTGQSGYLVRAVFDDSSFVIPGEEVKVAGVNAGTIQSIDLTQHNQAALVLRITNRKFVPFRTDAHCAIDLESLLGEQYVQCTATQPRAAGTAPAPPLPAIPAGADAGQHLLGSKNTTAPVGFDLLQDIQRLPQQEFFRELIAGLGAGLDGNGHELNAALKSADPALQETDQVISVLAREDKTLAQLTDDSARVLAPLAAQRQHLGGFFAHAGAVAAASATESKAIQANLEDFPPFLKQFVPAAQRLTSLARQFTPALQALQAQAPSIDAATKNLGPLAQSAIPALKTLGTFAQRGETVFPQINRVASQLLSLSKPLQPLATDIAAIAKSFDDSGGIEDVMRFIYYYAGSVNGEDSLGHYIRAHVTLGAVQRTSTPQGPGSSATFACSLATPKCQGLGGVAARAGAARATTAKTTSTAAKTTSTAAKTTGTTSKTSDPKLTQQLAGDRALLGYLEKP